MVPSRTPRSLVTACIAIALLASSALSAGAYQLRGVVYGDSAPLAGATVSLVNAGTGAAAGSTATGATGAYALAVPDGRYDLTVAAARYEPASVRGIVVAGADVVQDVALVSRPSLTGVVTTSDGVPVPGATVVVLGASDYNYWLPQAGPVTTDAAGRYTIDPAPTGKFYLQVSNHLEPGTLLPNDWSYTLMEFEIGGATTKDLALPKVATVSGTISVAGGTPFPGVSVGMSQYHYGQHPGWYVQTQSLGGSDASGRYEVRGFAVGEWTDLMVTPFNDPTYSVINVSLNLLADLRRDFTLSRPSLDGVVRTSTGEPVAGAEVSVLGAGNLNYWQVLAGPVRTDAAGRYAFDQVPAGKAFLEIRNYAEQGDLMPNWWRAVKQDFEVLESGTRDITLPKVATLAGRTLDAAGFPVPDSEVRTNQSIWSSSGWWMETKSAWRSQGPFADYETRGFAYGFMDIVVTPPEPTGYSTYYGRLLDFWGDRRLDFTLSRVDVSGVLRTGAGAPVAGAQMKFVGSVDPFYFVDLSGTVTTDAEGRFAFDRAPSGMAYLDMGNPSDQTGLLPDTWRAVSLRYDVRSSGPRDVTLPPVATLRGKTTDANGVPVDDVQVLLDKSVWDGTWYITTRGGMNSDAAGDYTARAFALGPTTLTVVPPYGSGFNTSSPIGFSISADRLLNVVLDMDDVAPPVILSGPVATKVTDTTAAIEWGTNEPARGGARFGTADPPAAQLDEEGFATAHTVTLDGLAPDTVYFVSVFASDFAGNGPVESGVISFRTLAAPDTTAPVFTAGPVVSGVTHATAVVEWATDEACTGLIVYGSAANPGSDWDDPVSATAHRVTLEGLEPATAYTLTVECADAAGNVATSSEIPFTTAPAPDGTAPVIVEGPLVIAVTDTTATVEWTTDEPATSGVSWNDGTRHDLVTDAALVTAHRVTITGLTPATAYTATVSSTDGAGNGPTLGGPVAFETLPGADTRPPVTIAGPFVVNITHQSAVFRWDTDEPADGVVEYGLAADALTLRDGHATLTREHNQPVTALAAGTDYFYRVCSTDAAGNRACSEVFSFRTDDTGATAAAPVVSGLAVSYASDRTAAVAWSTNVPADSLVQYQAAGGAVRQAASGAKVLQHQLVLTGLDPATQYDVRVGGVDGGGATVLGPAGAPARPRTALAAQVALTTATVADTTPPAIVEGPAVVEVGATHAVVRWVTDEIANSVVRYGRAGADLRERAASIALVTEHRVTLTNLRPGSAYEAIVRSTDPANNGPTESGVVAFTTLAPVPLFTDAFDDALATGDPDWVVAAGAWSGVAGTWVSDKATNDLCTIARFDLAARPLTAGVVRARVKLTNVFRGKANGAVVFAYANPATYRYVRVEAGLVAIGQQGVVGGTAGGVKKRFAAAFAVGRAKQLTVEVRPDGRVRVFAGARLVGSHRFPAAVAGGVGLAASRAKTVFDDVAVFDETALGE
jgi:hypothetical protein